MIFCLWQDALNPGRNRGFAFIEYYNNACAEYARQKMSSGNFKLEGNTPTVTWADPKSAPDSAAAAQVNFKTPMTFVLVSLRCHTNPYRLGNQLQLPGRRPPPQTHTHPKKKPKTKNKAEILFSYP